MNKLQFYRDVQSIQQTLLDKAVDDTRLPLDLEEMTLTIDQASYQNYENYNNFLKNQQEIVQTMSRRSRRDYLMRMQDVQEYIVGQPYKSPTVKNDYYHMEKMFYSFRVLNNATNVYPLSHVSYTHYADAKERLIFQSGKDTKLKIAPINLLSIRQETEELFERCVHTQDEIESYDGEIAGLYGSQISDIDDNLYKGTELSLEQGEESLYQACLMNGYACFMVHHMENRDIPMRSRLFLVNQTRQAVKAWAGNLVPKLDMGNQT